MDGTCWAYAEGEVGHVFIDGIITPEFHKDVRAQLESPQVKNSKSLIVHITSAGGSVYAGYNTYHVLRSAGKPITTVIEGEAQSMATFIAMAGEKIIMLDPGIYMIHNPSQGLEGDADALQGGAEELRKIEAEMIKVYAEKTRLPEDQIRAMMKRETRMTAFEAKKMGFVTEVSKQLKAVAIGKKMESQNWKQKLLNTIASALGEVKAVDLRTKDGKAINVESEDAANLVGKAVKMEGAILSDGEYPLEDGRMLVVQSGVVKDVKAALPQPPAPQEDPEKAAYQKQIADLQAQINTQTQAALTAQQAATKAAEEKAQLATAMGEIKKEVESMKVTTVGVDTNPNTPVAVRDSGNGYMREPIAGVRVAPSAQAIDMTRSFLIQEMPWIEQHYPPGYFDKYKKGGPNAVSILETNFNYTWPGILSTDLFYKPTMQAPALSDFGRIDQDIKSHKQYNLVTELNKIVKPYAGCGGTPATDRQLITNTTVRTKEFQVYEGWCKDDFTGQLSGSYNLLAQEWLKTGLRQFDPAGTPIDTVIMTVMKDAIQRDVFRRMFFAAGNSSDDDYNQFDGYWDRLIDSSGGPSNYCVLRAGSSIQGALTAGNALTHLGTAYTAAKPILKNNPKARFYVTRTVWDNYYDSLIGNGAVSEQQFRNLTEGVNGNPSEPPRALTYKGYPVIPVDLWDIFLTETDNPLYNAGIQRNLISFTIPENHIFGVENGADLNKIESWYEMKDQKRYYRSNFKLGYNYLHCDLSVIMY